MGKARQRGSNRRAVPFVSRDPRTGPPFLLEPSAVPGSRPARRLPLGRQRWATSTDGTVRLPTPESKAKHSAPTEIILLIFFGRIPIRLVLFFFSASFRQQVRSATVKEKQLWQPGPAQTTTQDAHGSMDGAGSEQASFPSDCQLRVTVRDITAGARTQPG